MSVLIYIFILEIREPSADKYYLLVDADHDHVLSFNDPNFHLYTRVLKSSHLDSYVVTVTITRIEWQVTFTKLTLV